MTEAQAAGLRAVGTSLASDKRWWGDDPDLEDSAERSVIQCHRLTGNEYNVRVRDAIGVIGLGDLQLIVDPKIPLNHLLYLFGESGLYPRSLLERSQLGVNATFFEVIAAWFTDACERLLRRGLVSDYSRATDDLACARGRIHTVATARSVLLGRPRIRCDFDVRTEDTSLNRVVKAATLMLLNSPVLPDELQRRCRRIRYRFSDVGPLTPGDMRTRPDLLTRAYGDVHPLALMILQGSGVGMDDGSRMSWTFLCRTPESVEEGVRNCLAQRLGSRWSITKRGLSLAGTFKRVLHPDLVFGNVEAVGDVKYKVSVDGSITRSDLNQVITFAAGHCVSKAGVLSFGNRVIGERVAVGSIDVSGFNWSLESSPPDSANQLEVQVRGWLDRPVPSVFNHWGHKSDA